MVLEMSKPNPVKSVLIAQPAPEGANPYQGVIDRFKLKVDFRAFHHVEGIAAKDFRKQKIEIKDYNAIIFTSKNSIDHFFRLCSEFKHEMPIDAKYFCTSEAIALYMQKYIQMRKRKVFFGKGSLNDILPYFSKHKDEKFLMPISEQSLSDFKETFDSAGIEIQKAIMFKTAISDLSDLADVKYDVLCFFSPTGIESLFKNFPDFEQGKTRIAVFGPTTRKSAEDNKLVVNIYAPEPGIPSMAKALETYINQLGK
jgi:uroporphyrinogen-III synthase